jgi:glycosyltransferase involved in cell wall biosynthesis
VGTSGARKGTRWLIEAFARARLNGWIAQDVQLVIVGCPSPSEVAQSRDLLVRVWKSDLRGSVKLFPVVSREAVAQFYRDASVYVQSSIVECLPLTLLEAMSHGLPIVSTVADGCKEAVVDGESGLLVPARSIEPLARAIAQLLDDPARARSLGARARERFAAHFSLEATLEPLVSAILHSKPRCCNPGGNDGASLPSR